MKLSQMDRVSVLACVTGLAMLAIFFVSEWLSVPVPDWLPMIITAIGGFEMYMVFDSVRRRRA
ncbi:MAG TPA: hypothetical protein VFS49_10420 [Croceibacterium sp.]|nr:hypothetical protein [Croceibacterium sp.]